MEAVFDRVFAICGPLSVVSVFAICYYLYRRRLYTIWQLRTTLAWPSLITRYRDHTRANRGRVGLWYYVAIVSIAGSVVSILALFLIRVLAVVVKTS
jgi:hypothetical protein